MNQKPLPIGTDDFKKLISNGCYYVDKTLFIKELLDKKGEVNLFTRPRRFGKTLNMSMLQYFFENTGSDQANAENRKLFEGMKILQTGEKYIAEMNSYPVISLSLKSAKQPTWELAYGCLKETIENEFQRHMDIVSSIPFSADRQKFTAIAERQGKPLDYVTALAFLSRQLKRHSQKTVIILIDEYDVPLENAYFHGFYTEMVDFIRSLFESALKTNSDLYFAVITGCLRITKESIFTGLNNLEVNSVLDADYGEYFGFTPLEVEKLLSDYDCSEKFATVKKWYDGYLFGDKDVYNPWSVLNYMKALRSNRKAFPVSYWSNTSSNNIVRSLIERADISTREDVESLIAGETIEKPIHVDITYEDVYSSMDNLWNFLFFTGYLKKVDCRLLCDELYATLAIPNKEVRQIYKTKITGWFRESIEQRDLSVVYRDMLEGNAKGFQDGVTELLQDTISFYDNAEAFYHGFMMGILGRLNTHSVKSNRESGDGRYDILIRGLNVDQPIVLIEFKLAKSFQDLEKEAVNALAQIRKKGYDREYKQDGYQRSFRYGMSFYKKSCLIKKEEINL